MFNLLNNYSENPVRDTLELWDRIIFNYLIGNTDCHLKNYSLLYKENMQSIKLAPAYDLVSNFPYKAGGEMSFFIGDKLELSSIAREDFVVASQNVNLGEKIAMKHFDDLSNKFEKALEKATDEMVFQGFTEAKKISEKILKRGN